MPRTFSIYGAFVADRSRFLVTAALAGASMLFVIGASLFAYSLFNPSQSDSLAFKALYSAGSSPAYADATSAVRSSDIAKVQGMNIANDGSIFLKGARLAAVSGSSLTASISYGATNFLWHVQLSPTSRFLDKDGKKISIADLKAGDRVNVTGILDTGAEEPTINAKVIRR